MGTKRRIINRGKSGRLTPEVVAAWQRADFHELNRLLRIAPWEANPLPSEITVLGCSEGDLDTNPDRLLERALMWQRKLLAVAGWPDCRATYEENLRDAEEGFDWARKRFENPPRGEYGTGTTPEERRQRMLDTAAEVEYRKGLLAGLDRVQKKWARP